MTRVLLRCDASPESGAGHAARCLSLAEAVRARGGDAVLCGTFSGEWVERRIRAVGAPVLPAVDEPRGLVGLAATWGADCLHLDHYGALGTTPDLLAEADAAGIVLSTAADFAFGARPAHIEINPNFGAGPHGTGFASRSLLGPQYAIVAQRVLDARARRAESPPGSSPSDPGSPVRCIVVMGGTDALGATPSAVELLVRAATGPVEAVVVTPDHVALAAGSAPRRGSVTLRYRPPVDDLAALLANADLAMSAAGTTVLELCCIGVPSALVCVTANQERGYRAAVEQGVVLGMGSPAVPAPDAVDTLRRLLVDTRLRRDLSEAGRAAVDGHGAARLLAEMDACVATGGRSC
jgi:spore coat polysaccharide biosynthesis predicted glycosyltransferase SpsG